MNRDAVRKEVSSGAGITDVGAATTMTYFVEYIVPAMQKILELTTDPERPLLLLLEVLGLQTPGPVPLLPRVAHRVAFLARLREPFSLGCLDVIPSLSHDAPPSSVDLVQRSE